MNRRQFLATTFGAALVARQPALGQEAKRPNVVLVMTDDQGYGDMSCHGNPKLKTPNIDRLGKEGVEFTQFYVCPVCAPTRAAPLRNTVGTKRPRRGLGGRSRTSYLRG